MNNWQRAAAILRGGNTLWVADHVGHLANQAWWASCLQVVDSDGDRVLVTTRQKAADLAELYGSFEAGWPK